MAQRFKIGDKARVIGDFDKSSWNGEIVTITDVMDDGLPYDYYTKRELPAGILDYDTACFDDYQLEELNAPTAGE